MKDVEKKIIRRLRAAKSSMQIKSHKELLENAAGIIEAQRVLISKMFTLRQVRNAFIDFCEQLEK